LTGNSEEFRLESQLTGVSRHLADLHFANVTLTSPLSENSDSADVDDTLLARPSFPGENLMVLIPKNVILLGQHVGHQST